MSNYQLQRERQMEAFKSLLNSEEAKNDWIYRVTIDTLYNYVSNGKNLLDLPFFTLKKKLA